ncbi:MAG: NF038120 family PEP-CTERM protein [Betaproteobacteria bacterium]
MKKFLTQVALGAAALFSVGAANAYVMDFDTNVDLTFAPFAPLLADGDAVLQGNFFANTQDVNNGGGLIAGLSNAADSGSCLNGVCPNNSQGTFLSVLNDGIVHFGALDGSTVKLTSLAAAFIPSPGIPAGSTVYLAVEGDRADGTFTSFYFPLSGSGAFQTVDTTQGGIRLGGSGSLLDGVTDIFTYGYFCNGATGSCGAFKTDLAQYALDNVTFSTPSVVPEPSEWMLMTLGLGAIAAMVRRRRSI